MSEPNGAFLRLTMPGEALAAWLEQRPAPASSWSDWRDMGGYVYEGGDNVAFAEASDATVSGMLSQSDAILARYATVRDALSDLFDADLPPYLKHFRHDPEAGTFVAGSAMFAEEMTFGVAFLALARGASAFFGPDDQGVAVIHNYVWGVDEEHMTYAGVGMGPGPVSTHLSGDQRTTAAVEFEDVAIEMAEGFEGGPPREFNDLDAILDASSGEGPRKQ